MFRRLSHALSSRRVWVFSYSIKSQIQHPKKVYCIDTGLRNAVSFRFSEDLGKLYENTVFLELKRRREEIYYWKDGKGRQVDFVIKEGIRVKEIIQVCFDIRKKETREREIKSMVKCMEEFKINKGLVITEDYEGKDIIGEMEIEYIPLWKWLL